MAKLYTMVQIKRVLQELAIVPVDGKINGDEAAKILTWRAEKEQNVIFQYQKTALRQHILQGHFQEGSVDPKSRGSRYPVAQVFVLPIAPKRRLNRKT
jgi:hypothetical protein